VASRVGGLRFAIDRVVLNNIVRFRVAFCAPAPLGRGTDIHQGVVLDLMSPTVDAVEVKHLLVGVANVDDGIVPEHSVHGVGTGVKTDEATTSEIEVPKCVALDYRWVAHDDSGAARRSISAAIDKCIALDHRTDGGAHVGQLNATPFVGFDVNTGDNEVLDARFSGARVGLEVDPGLRKRAIGPDQLSAALTGNDGLYGQVIRALYVGESKSLGAAVYGVVNLGLFVIGWPGFMVFLSGVGLWQRRVIWRHKRAPK
jgi:hypothetical protein